MTNKRKTHFIQFNIINYYQFLKLDLLEEAITFASAFTDIMLLEDISFIARKILTYFKNRIWTRCDLQDDFNVTMRRSEFAMVAGIVGLFLLSKTKEEFH